MPAAVWKNLQCLQSIDGEIVLAFYSLWSVCGEGFLQTRSGALGKVCLAYAREKLYNGKMDEKKSESTNT